MAVVKDFECTYCGSITEEIVEGGCENAEYWCSNCFDIRYHASVCNGGKNVTPALAAYGGSDWTGHVRYESPICKAGKNDPVNSAGESITKKVEKKREERLDKIRFKRNKNRKIYF